MSGRGLYFFGGLGLGLSIGAGIENWPLLLLGNVIAIVCAARLHWPWPTASHQPTNSEAKP